MPQITQVIIIYKRIKRIDCENRIFKDCTPLWEIYFAFPIKMDNRNFRYDGSKANVTLPYLSIKKAHMTNLAEENIGEVVSCENEIAVLVKA